MQQFLLDYSPEIVILVSTFAATVVALSGETWSRESGVAFRKRLTPLGWMAVVFLCIACIAGIKNAVDNVSDKHSTQSEIENATSETRPRKPEKRQKSRENWKRVLARKRSKTWGTQINK